jgi:single-stranded-DNA-specific exonuclease
MKWIPTTVPDPSDVAELQQVLGVSKTIATLLRQRGIEDFDQAKAFFRPQLEQLHDPLLMKDMDKAVARIQEAQAKGETIMVYGDYDVDGTSAVALVTSYFQHNGQKVHYYIPDRYTEGYGLSSKGISTAHELGCTLLIVLDCGIKAFTPIAEANALGIAVIVCDHHLPEAQLPNALAILDPKRKDCHYPYKELCGCGIGLKLVQALTQAAGQPLEAVLPYLDLAAIAIAADIVPITGENRVIAAFGLQQVQQHPRPGIAPFLKKLKGPLKITDLVFKIAPQINAAGRMHHGKEAVALFLETDPQKGQEKSTAIEAYNTQRRTVDEQTTKEALAQLESKGETARFSTVVWDENWHKGVLGIVASRLIETYYCPTVVLAKNGQYYTGSVRSIRGFDVHEALNDCASYLSQFGGHKYAAGLTLEASQLDAFKAAFEARVRQELSPDDLIPFKKYDALVTLEELRPKFYRIMEQMRPFGPQNMRPVFRTNNCRATANTKAVGADNTHLKLEIEDAAGVTMPAIAFGWGKQLSSIQKAPSFDVLYTLEENHYQGHVSLQLQLKDLKINS